MSAPAKARVKLPRNRGHIHLPSVHVRGLNGREDTGFDYEEDLHIFERAGHRSVERVVTLVAVIDDQERLIRETNDLLCPEEMAELESGRYLAVELDILLDRGNPAGSAVMEQRGREEFARQLRISKGEEHACASCGCSETRCCSGGCCWATETLCSRCI